MLYQADAFNQPLNLDTSKVISMYQMFQYADAFNQPLDFDVSRVTNMHYMLHYTNALGDCNKRAIDGSLSANTRWPYSSWLLP